MINSCATHLPDYTNKEQKTIEPTLGMYYTAERKALGALVLKRIYDQDKDKNK